MEWIFLEMLVALLLAVIIVAWTMWPRYKTDQAKKADQAKPDGNERARGGVDRD